MSSARSQSGRNFAALTWHGTFMAAGTALTQPTTLLPAYVALLGGSPSWVGLMTTLLTAGSVLPQLAFAQWVESKARKRPFLIGAVYARAASLLTLGGLTLWLGRDGGIVLLAVLAVLLTAFAVGGSLGSVAYTDVYGKSVPPGRRGRFYGTRQLLGSLAALAVTLLAARLLRRAGLSPQTDYADIFLLAGTLMAVAGIGFILVQEDPGHAIAQPSWAHYLRRIPGIVRARPAVQSLVTIENLASFHLMILPFYMLLAETELHVAAATAATYTLIQIVGGALSNLLWGMANDRLGSTWVLRACVALGAFLPPFALLIAHTAPDAYGIVFLLLGAAVNSRTLAFNNVLVDIAPPGERATYTGLVGTLTAPSLVLPLAGGLLISAAGYSVVFLAVSAVLAASLLWLLRAQSRKTFAAP